MFEHLFGLAVIFGPGVIIGMLTALLCTPLIRANFFLGVLLGALAIGALSAVATWKAVGVARDDQAACEVEQAASLGERLLDCEAAGLWVAFPLFNAAAAFLVFLVGSGLIALRR